MWRNQAVAGAVVWFAALATRGVEAIMPMAEIRLTNTPGFVYAAPAAFGADVPSAKRPLQLLVTEPLGLKDGCDPKVADEVWKGQAKELGMDGFALLVSRGNCSFETKAIMADRLGAAAVIIYNSLEGMWSNRSAVADKFDYECANGAAYIQHVSSPPWSPANVAPQCSADPKCASHRCLVTNHTDPTQGTQMCCAWDMYITMGADGALPSATHPEPKIPAVFVKMADSDLLLQVVRSTSKQPVMATLSERPRPWINVSSFLIWFMGVATVVLASWHSAMTMRDRDRKARSAREAPPGPPGPWGEEEEDEEIAVDLSVAHTVGFICMASAFLILLFYVNLNGVINVMYTISAGSAVSGILMRPLVKRTLPRRLWNRTACTSQRIGISLSLLDVLSTCLGMGLSLWWYFVHKKHPSYAWVLQDTMGICLCILFLSLVRFPNIKVATVLLCLAFVYDIFFVFISPIFFKESVMVKVATGGTPKADPTFCEKYPTAHDCQTRDELPMLLILPRINDFTGGFTMLGLGDIILPGLLVAFAARYDHSVGLPLCKGYYRIMCVGYAIGLMMANLAVYIMHMGQPALLYLVPCTLGVFALVAFREGTLLHMWHGPPSLQPNYRPSPRRSPAAGLSVLPGNPHVPLPTQPGGATSGPGGAGGMAPLSTTATAEVEPLLDP